MKRKSEKTSNGKYERYCLWCGRRFETYLPQTKYCKHKECQAWAVKIRQIRRKRPEVAEHELEQLIMPLISESVL